VILLEDKTLPSENSDYSLPGRIEDSNFGYEIPAKPRPKNRSLVIAGIAFVLVSAGFFSYYFINQNEIDSQIIDNTELKSIEEKMVIHYGVGKFGSDHAHAAIAVFIDDVQLNFGLPVFQLQSKYVHFEDRNSYLIHKHATGVPLDMLFSSFGMNVSSECIRTHSTEHCVDSENSLVFMINEKIYSDITTYEIKHNDRILISYGDAEDVTMQLRYLDSLEIHDLPRQNYLSPGKDFSV
jgi:hypothetical protein